MILWTTKKSLSFGLFFVGDDFQEKGHQLSREIRNPSPSRADVRPLCPPLSPPFPPFPPQSSVSRLIPQLH